MKKVFVDKTNFLNRSFFYKTKDYFCLKKLLKRLKNGNLERNY